MSNSQYFVLQASHFKAMLLFSLPDPNEDDSWLLGARFSAPPTEPVVATIRPGYEDAERLHYFGTPPIISDKFADALREAGVDNLDLYDTVLQSADGKVEFQGYKAFNVIGLVSAADFSKSKFNPDVPSRMLDASFEQLVIDEEKTGGALIFRLAEYVGAVLVHQSVKEHVEALKFPHLNFISANSFIS